MSQFSAEAEGGAPQIWDAFAETGFPWISIDEASGGSGGSLLDALEVLRLVGYHAAPIPAAENGVLAGWLLAASNQEIPSGVATVVPSPIGQVIGTLSGNEIKLNGFAERVPWLELRRKSLSSSKSTQSIMSHRSTASFVRSRL